jgi:putative heme-binding domain-containing protein
MTPREIWQIAAYVRSLGRVPNEPVSGDAKRGRELVRGKGGCLQCHVIAGEGGQTGPALTDIGIRRSPSYIRTKLLDPDKDLSGNFSQVRLTTRNGHKVSGIRLNEDTWSIQVRDMSNRLHSFWKQDLIDLKVEQRTLMPSYREQLKDDQVNDVVAYLTGLRGVQ